MKPFKGLDKYAQLIINKGVNLDENEELFINCPVEAAEFARLLAKYAYAAKAKRVSVIWTDDQIKRERHLNEDLETLCEVPQWSVAQRELIVQKKGAYIAILANDPELLADIDPQKVSKAAQALRKAYKTFSDASMSNEIRWCLVAYPNLAWAKKISPNLNDEQAMQRLWQLIGKTMRLDKADPVKAWERHEKKLKKYCRILNSAKISQISYKNSLGTDFTIGLPKNYVFTACGEKSKYGREFLANMPTEEVFSAPEKNSANGKLVASMPLLRNGKRIENFWITFKDGKVVDYNAEVGYDTLKGIIETDEGSSRLGEIALVPFDSPIQKLNTLFYNTLFDENASCHFALGKAYAACVKGGEFLSQEKLDKLGLNYSIEHVDFMVGTADLEIIATKQNGEKMPIFKDGNFVI